MTKYLSKDIIQWRQQSKQLDAGFLAEMSSVIRKSVICRKLRGRRLKDGINVFKSWTIINVHVLREVGVLTASIGQYSLPGCQPELCTSS